MWCVWGNLTHTHDVYTCSPESAEAETSYLFLLPEKHPLIKHSIHLHPMKVLIQQNKKKVKDTSYMGPVFSGSCTLSSCHSPRGFTPQLRSLCLWQRRAWKLLSNSTLILMPGVPRILEVPKVGGQGTRLGRWPGADPRPQEAPGGGDRSIWGCYSVVAGTHHPPGRRRAGDPQGAGRGWRGHTQPSGRGRHLVVSALAVSL